MKNASGLILGIDLCNEFSQVCYFDQKTQKAESVPLQNSEVILRNPVKLDEIFENSREGLPIQMNELVSLAGYLIEAAKKFTKKTDVSVIYVTVADFNITVLDAIKNAFLMYGVESESLRFISHEECYAYYAFSMKKELWNGGVLLLDFFDKGLKAIVLSDVRIKNTDIIVEEQQLFEEQILQQAAKHEIPAAEIDNLLESIARQAMGERVVSSVYLTGTGFNTDDLPQAFLKYICGRHRVFVGQNLYVKGACIAAYQDTFGNRFSDTVFACSNRITTGIEIGIEERGKSKILRIVRPGINWYEAKKTFEFIVDDCTEIRLNMIPVARKENYEEVIDLTEFPYRSNKTTKIKVTFEFTSDDRCLVTVKDKGFGDIARSSEKLIYKNLSL